MSLAIVASVAAGLVTAGPVGIARAQVEPGAPTPSRSLTLLVRTADGNRASAVVKGERFRVSGRATPPTPGDRVTVYVGRGNRLLATAHVVPTKTGRFATRLHVDTAGPLVVAARLDAADGTVADAGPVSLAVRNIGRPRSGCRAATITRATRGVPAGALPDRVRPSPGMILSPGARLRLATGRVTLTLGDLRFRVSRGTVVVACRAVRLAHGRMRVDNIGTRTSVIHALLPRGELSRTTRGARVALAASGARVVVIRGGAHLASAKHPVSSLDAIAGDVAVIGHDGLPRLTTWPFGRSPDDRRVPATAIPAYWADGLSCSTGCRPAGAVAGWPLRPFFAQHALRSGLNDLRPANMHIGIDIQALDGTKVYAVQSGRASIARQGTVDAHVQVGRYLYWHVVPRVLPGQFVRAYHTVVGVIRRGAGHLHFSEVQGEEDYLNPLRPGGTVLTPYRDTERPVIGRAHRYGGTVFVEVFDPQSFRVTLKYRTPVMAPAAVAWRARTRHGTTPLIFTYRGSQHLPNSAKWIYGPGTHLPSHGRTMGWACFWSHVICVPRWNYRLAGVPVDASAITVYAWDWAGNVSARSVDLR